MILVNCIATIFTPSDSGFEMLVILLQIEIMENWNYKQINTPFGRSVNRDSRNIAFYLDF